MQGSPATLGSSGPGETTHAIAQGSGLSDEGLFYAVFTIGLFETTKTMSHPMKRSWMPVPVPEHLKHHRRDTLSQIFQLPTSHNIEWPAVLSLLEAERSVGAAPLRQVHGYGPSRDR